MNRARGGCRVDRAWRSMMPLLVLLVLMGARPALGAEIMVNGAKTFLQEKVYHLDASIDYDFSDQALDALHNGVPLVVLLDIEISRVRSYLWNETVTVLHQRYQLAYEALTSRYVITNLNSGADTYYSSLGKAVAALGDIDSLPLLDAGLLSPDERYMIALRASLDLEALPVPMRIMGYFSSDWRLASEWHAWPLE